MLESKKKLVRITTVPLSLDKILAGQLSFMNNHYEVVAISSEKEYLIRCAENEGVRYKHIEMTRKITPFKDFISLLKLISFLKIEKPLIIHSHTPKAGIIAMLASRIANIPIRLHTVAGLPLMEETGFKRMLLVLIEKLTYAFSTFVIINSHGLYKYITDNNYITKNKSKVIGNGSSNGIDTKYFSPDKVSKSQVQMIKNELKIGEDDFVFVFVGRLVGDKGINELVTAFEKISKINFSVKLLLVGMFEKDLDPLDTRTQEEIINNKNILFVGYQVDIRPYLACSRVLIFPSYREGFPNVVLQAGAMGLPCIVTNINGCNEIIKDEINGILIPVKSTDAIVKAVFKIISEKSFFESLKLNARIMISSRYNQTDLWHSLLDEYKSLDKTYQNKNKA